MKPIVTQSGLAYRTRAMEIEKAARFAKCLSANAKFEGVEIVESVLCKTDARWFVAFRPTSQAAQEALAAREQDERAERAAAQGFTFLLDDEGSRPFYYCHSHHSGEVYEVTEQGCSCPDFEYRCRAAGIRCKHQISLRDAAAEGRLSTW